MRRREIGMRMIWVKALRPKVESRFNPGIYLTQLYGIFIGLSYIVVFPFRVFMQITGFMKGLYMCPCPNLLQF